MIVYARRLSAVGAHSTVGPSQKMRARERRDGQAGRRAGRGPVAEKGPSSQLVSGRHPKHRRRQDGLRGGQQQRRYPAAEDPSVEIFKVHGTEPGEPGKGKQSMPT